jgi:hypothetical protein
MWKEGVKLPHLTETPEGGRVEVAEGVFIHWHRRDAGEWTVRITADDGVELRDVAVEQGLH